MRTTQTIELSAEETRTVENFLGLVDEIAHITNATMIDVFGYLVEHADIVGDFAWEFNGTLQIPDIVKS